MSARRLARIQISPELIKELICLLKSYRVPADLKPSISAEGAVELVIESEFFQETDIDAGAKIPAMRVNVHSKCHHLRPYLRSIEVESESGKEFKTIYYRKEEVEL